MGPCPFSRRAFTLIELMVVSAILVAAKKSDKKSDKESDKKGATAVRLIRGFQSIE